MDEDDVEENWGTDATKREEEFEGITALHGATNPPKLQRYPLSLLTQQMKLELPRLLQEIEAVWTEKKT